MWKRNLALFLLGGAILVACAKVPYTNRLQFNLVPDGIMRGIGKTTYPQMLQKETLLKTGPGYTTLMRVGPRIAKVANEPKYDWQFSMIKSETVNAWCLPGGYIGFYQGILPVLSNESGMAAVMGHEVAHATAHHGAERLSQKLALLGGLAGLYLYLDAKADIPDEYKLIIVGAVGVGALFGVVLPFSRAHEAEADVIGMMYMASSGYPPAQSVEVWKRMKKLSPNSGPTFLSTHPSHEQRIEHLQEWLPQGNKKYGRSAKHKGVTTVIWK